MATRFLAMCQVNTITVHTMLFTTLSQIILASELTLLCAAAKKMVNAIINNFFISAIVPNGQVQEAQG